MKDKSIPGLEDITSSEMAACVRDVLDDAISRIDILTDVIRQLAEVVVVDGDESVITRGQCVAAKRQIVKAVTSLLEEAS